MTLKRQMLRLLVLILIVETVLPLGMLVFRNRLIFLPSETPAPQERLWKFRDQDAHIAVVERPDGRKLLAYDAQPIARPDDEAAKFVHACVQPAVEKMNDALAKKDTPYRHVVACLAKVIEQK